MSLGSPVRSWLAASVRGTALEAAHDDEWRFSHRTAHRPPVRLPTGALAKVGHHRRVVAGADLR